MFRNSVGGLLLLAMVLLSTQPATSQVTTFDTIITTTCDGTIRLFPDNQLLNVNIDIPFISRMYGKFVEGIRTYVKTKCGSFFNEDEFNRRFDIGNTILVGNRWFQNVEDRSDACLDNPITFTRDGLKMFHLIFGSHEYDMPSTCNWKTWEENGTCAFEYSVRGVQDIILQVRTERCSRYGGFPRIFVGCRGTGCSIITPCSSSSSCGSDQICVDVVDFFGKDNFINFLTSVGFYESEESAGDPRNLIKEAIATFGNLFPGGVRVGSSVCLPKVIGFLTSNIDSVVRGSPKWDYLWNRFGAIFNVVWVPGKVGTNISPDCIDIITQWVLANSLMNPWDGLVNGTSPLVPKSSWVTIPNVVYPTGETHIVSVQCDGMIHAFAGTAFPIRIYHPKLVDVLEFWAEQNMASYPIENINTYLNNMAIWRLDPYLYSMQGIHSTFGNIRNMWDPDFYFDLTGIGMSILNITNWDNNKRMDVTIGLRNDAPNPLGADFRANVRASQCPGQVKGLTSLHVTCVGEVCQQLLLRKTCSTSADCSVGKCQTLDGYYENDVVAQVLWGSDDQNVPTPWAAHFRCPAREYPGKNYVKLTTEQPIREMLNAVWVGMQYANCDGRAPDKCVSECVIHGTSCLPANGVPPTWSTNSGFCFPDVAAITGSSLYSQKHGGAVTFSNIRSPPFPGYTSAEVVVDAFPEPTSPLLQRPEAFKGVETLLIGSCEGQFRIFPDNELLSVSIDAEIVPRLFGEYMKSIERYVTARCEAKGKTPPKLNDGSGRFIKRFHPISFFVYSGLVDDYDSCLDDKDTFVRDFLKYFKENFMYGESLFLPSTCNNVTWFEEGSCKLKIPMRIIPDTAIIINIERCDTNFGYVRFAVGCEGGGCNAIANPCSNDADCGGNSRCVDPIHEIGSEKVFNFFRDTLHFVGPHATQSNAVRDLFNDFITQFGSYFKDSPTPGPGNKKVCFPKEYTNPDLSFFLYGDELLAFEELAVCGMDGWHLLNSRAGPNEVRFRGSFNPGTLPGARGRSYPHTHPRPWFDFLFVRGETVRDTFKRTWPVGGGECFSHDDCSTSDVLNLCLSSYDMCKIGADTGSDCDLLPTTDFKCACSAGQELKSNLSSYLVSYGDKCQHTTTSPTEFYYAIITDRYPGTPTYTPWNGLLKDGKTHFQREWSPFPEVRIPSGETHVMSVQCDGLITFFEGTPFAIRVYLPKKQELLQFIADKYISSMSSWIPLGMDPITAFNREQSPWRPEMYLSRLLMNTAVFPHFASIASKFDFGSSVLGMGDFTFEKFIDGKEAGVGLSFNGMREVMGDDFKANIRFQQCSDYPNGLVGMDVTCVGEICQNLQLKKPCMLGSLCRVGSCVSTHYYDHDLLAAILWGADPHFDILREYGDNWTSVTTCPTRTRVGYQGVVHETTNTKLFQNTASLYSLLIEGDCKGRPQCACGSGCRWNESDSSCSATSSSVDPVWEQQEIGLCLPKLFPFPDAFIRDLGYKTGRKGGMDSAEIYSVDYGTLMGRPVTIYGVDSSIEVIGAAQMESVRIPDFSCGSSGGGSTDTESDSSGSHGDSSSDSDSSSEDGVDNSAGITPSDNDTESDGLPTAIRVIVLVGSILCLGVVALAGKSLAKGRTKQEGTFTLQSLPNETELVMEERTDCE
eukprot:TRINITY_DN3416_c0_g1_i13.p1 TRINITY_DN3416_c0_g1~~TRINITY_DN3416_c0_g1_i13.p1  ORF type:complete len:1645 (+),score=302.28 TRINITY_DN3416_c0_g1_i13:43-4977(+)